MLDALGDRRVDGHAGSDPVGEVQARNTFVGFDVTRAGGRGDVGRQGRRRFIAAAVPAGIRPGEPVADELLVEARLHDAFPIAVGRPVPRRVGGEDLVGQHHRAVLVDAELELGVGDDDSLGQRVLGGLRVDLQGAVPQLRRSLGADQVDDLVEGDVLVVLPQFGFRRRGEQRLGELAGLGHARREARCHTPARSCGSRSARNRSGSHGPRTRPASSPARAPPAPGPAPPPGCARRRAGPRGGWGRRVDPG